MAGCLWEGLIEAEIRSLRERIAPRGPGGCGGLRLNAPAKINLNLLVGPRREDGYHPLDSLVARITFYDRLDVYSRSDGRVNFRCEGLDCGDDSRNLALGAGRALLAEAGDAPGADIVLHKRIPPGGGLGGGSSDAAAVLAGLVELWGLDIQPGRLGALAAELGSDVPLFLGPAGVRMTGRGEHIQPIEMYPFWAVLILPPLACSTAAVYDGFDAEPSAGAGPTTPLEMLTQPPSMWRDQLVNQLAPAAMRLYAPLGEMHGELVETVRLPVAMSGSGSAMFVLCDGRDEAMEVIQRVPPKMQNLCRIVRKNPLP